MCGGGHCGCGKHHGAVLHGRWNACHSGQHRQRDLLGLARLHRGCDGDVHRHGDGECRVRLERYDAVDADGRPDGNRCRVRHGWRHARGQSTDRELPTEHRNGCTDDGSGADKLDRPSYSVWPGVRRPSESPRHEGPELTHRLIRNQAARASGSVRGLEAFPAGSSGEPVVVGGPPPRKRDAPGPDRGVPLRNQWRGFLHGT